jgi:hypothetical protein
MSGARDSASGTSVRGVARLAALAVLGVFLAGTRVQAQGAANNCVVTTSLVGGIADDVCRKANDLFSFLVPQMGVALAGGNSVLGEGGTLGGWGKRSATLRLSAVNGNLPKNTLPLTLTRPAAVGDDFGASSTAVPMASLDLAIGAYEGIPVGLTNVFGVDVLVGITGIPAVKSGHFRLKSTNASYAYSYGARVGILQESSVIPGISFSALHRALPTLEADYTPTNDTIKVRNAQLSANAYRLVASKRFTVIGVAVGVGRDDIEGETGLGAVVNETVNGTPQRASIVFPTLQEKTSRTTAFVNASFGLFAARVVAEYGRSSAGTARETLNTFGGHRPNEAYSYGSLGVTIRF